MLPETGLQPVKCKLEVVSSRLVGGGAGGCGDSVVREAQGREDVLREYISILVVVIVGR
jgi:hypothetical protein